MKKILVKVKGTQVIDGESAVIELTTEGTLREFEGDYIITYSDDPTESGTQTKTQLTIQKNGTVILDRRGDLNSRLIITEGERNNCLYAIPQGSMTLGIYGKQVKSNMSSCGGSLKMVYSIDMNLTPLSDNKVEIFVEER
ncbi:MAG: DUF1934 domain-containing protein [Ruminococcaceae bacterium]|nr:DUF1934 domain-containing protein [Oscillospiraceae bacterium]